MLTNEQTVIKHRDTPTVVFTVYDAVTGLPADLTDATAVLHLALSNGGPPISKPGMILDPQAGEVTVQVDGTIAVGCYDYEIELTRDGATVTAPTDGFGTLLVRPDIA